MRHFQRCVVLKLENAVMWGVIHVEKSIITTNQRRRITEPLLQVCRRW